MRIHSLTFKTICFVTLSGVFASVGCGPGPDRAANVPASPEVNRNQPKEPGVSAMIPLGTHKWECQCSCNFGDGTSMQATWDSEFGTKCGTANGKACQDTKSYKMGKLSDCQNVLVPNKAAANVGSDAGVDPTGGNTPTPTRPPVNGSPAVNNVR